MRRHKEPEIRRNELLEAAQRLFLEKGYNKTTVQDILDVDGLSKGVFYYYFKSKEEVMDAIIERIVEAEVANAKKIVNDAGMTPSQKLNAILTGKGLSEENNKNKESVVSQLHRAENAEMHQKSMVRTIIALSPVIANILTDKDGYHYFSTDYPEETVALFLAAGQFIFDDSLFQWNEEQRTRLAAAFIEMMEKTLGVQAGYFGEIKAWLHHIGLDI